MPPADNFTIAGYDEICQVAEEWLSGKIASREEAVTRAVEVFVEAKMEFVPEGSLRLTNAGVERVARENTALREQIGRVLDRRADRNDRAKGGLNGQAIKDDESS